MIVVKGDASNMHGRFVVRGDIIGATAWSRCQRVIDGYTQSLPSMARVERNNSCLQKVPKLSTFHDKPIDLSVCLKMLRLIMLVLMPAAPILSNLKNVAGISASSLFWNWR